MLLFGVLVIAMILLFVWCAARIAARADDAMQIREDKLLVPETTSVPEPTETPAPRTWTRYDVPLDDELQIYIGELCREYEVPANVVMAMIEVESGFDAELVGDGGNSWGLMQIYATQHTARCVRLGAWNLLDPKANVRVGIDFMGELLATGHGIEWALSWYNGWGGEPCDYAGAVLRIAEELLESSQLVVEE